MFYVNGTDIKLTRGDNATLAVDLKNADGSTYTLQANDKLYLSVSQGGKSTPLLQIIADNEGIFRFVPSDTKSMNFGKYRYDIQLTMADGEIYTVIPVSIFEILEEITCNA